MLIKYSPLFSINEKITHALMRIEAVKEQTKLLPLNPTVLASLRETAKLYTTHYSTLIEGNQLTPQEIKQTIKLKGHFPGKERDEREVKGYYTALDKVEDYAAKQTAITEKLIQRLHALVMNDGRRRVKPSIYRDGQNVIRNSQNRSIVYMPPTAEDVPLLMSGMIDWIHKQKKLPIPIVAAIVHYQFATIHPYYDGNGRTARLLTTLVLHQGGYDLKGLYSLEEYYAQNLPAYYNAISIGPSHNYYEGRATSDITSWISYFLEGMAIAFEKVRNKMLESQKKGRKDYRVLMRLLDPRQRKALGLFKKYTIVTSKQIGNLFGFRPRTSSSLCQKWVQEDFLSIADPSFKARKYRLSPKFTLLI